ncbi:MAG: copper oxidase [Alphaproteobacteria bacterium]|nr:copper oxidase [Alphaproteobacteria bacterium]
MIPLALALALLAAPAFAQHSHHPRTPVPKAAPHAHGAPAGARNAPMAAPEARGAQYLPSRMVDGVREFELSTGLVRWHILPKVMVDAMAYNGQVPGPTIRAKPGEKVRIKVANKLNEPTSVHWHGIDVPFDQDGVPGMSQKPIAPGATHTYAFTIPDTPGTFMYHTHVHADRQQALGLYGAFIIEDPKAPAYAGEYLIQLGEWRVDADGKAQPAMQMDGMLPTHFTFNGKAFPLIETIKAKVGDRLLFRILGTGQFIHPIHFHGPAFTIVATDGHPVPEAARLTKDTVLVGPGERYDVVWTPTRPGQWMLHCHINHHATNHDGADHGGMMLIIDVAG